MQPLTICAGRIDETEYWDAAWLASRGIARIFGVYLFDPTRRVHCCELTASRECWEQLTATWEPSRDLTDAERERIDDEIRDSSDPSVHYFHFHIAPFDAGDPTFYLADPEPGESPEDFYLRAMREAEDACAANPVW